MIYETTGTCSRAIDLELDEKHIIHKAEFIGGCSGNTQGIARLVQGMKAEDAIQKIEGIRCGEKNTSCPDQLAQALKKAIQ